MRSDETTRVGYRDDLLRTGYLSDYLRYRKNGYHIQTILST